MLVSEYRRHSGMEQSTKVCVSANRQIVWDKKLFFLMCHLMLHFVSAQQSRWAIMENGFSPRWAEWLFIAGWWFFHPALKSIWNGSKKELSFDTDRSQMWDNHKVVFLAALGVWEAWFNLIHTTGWTQWATIVLHNVCVCMCTHAHTDKYTHMLRCQNQTTTLLLIVSLPHRCSIIKFTSIATTGVA